MEFRDPRKVETIELPSFPTILNKDWSIKEKGATVEIYEWLTVKDQREILKNNKRENTVDIGVDAVLRAIKSWSFTENGEPMPITADNLDRLPTKDLLVLIKITEGNSVESTDTKKK